MYLHNRLFIGCLLFIFFSLFGGGCEVLSTEVQPGILDEENEEITHIDNNYLISSGNYRTSVRMASIEKEQIGLLKLSGIDGIVSFFDDSWRIVIKYLAYNNIETEVLIPKNIQFITVNTLDNSIVSSDTYFHLTLKGSILRDSYLLSERLIQVNRYLPIMVNLNLTSIDPEFNKPSEKYKTLVLSSISDVHNDRISASAFLNFSNFYRAYIDDVIGLGDYVNGSLATTLTLNNLQGWDRIIKTIGNHDAYNEWPSPSVVSEQECYDTWLKNDIDKWKVVYSENKTYFYKDYPDAMIRTIYLDYMHWDEVNDSDGQIAWLKNTLYGETSNSAAVKGYHVVICVHTLPISKGSGFPVLFDEGFNYLDSSLFKNDDNTPKGLFNSTVPDIVNEFVTRHNGIFCCYLAGRRHVTAIGTYENFTNQLYIIQPCAFIGPPRDCAYVLGTDYELQFFVYSFDSKNRFIRIYKPGANYNRNLQYTESIFLQYGNAPKVLAAH